mgnify:CR=1 FL=1
MLKTRIIPVLLLRNGRMVKGRQFRDFRDTGDPVSAARIYNAQYADELVFLDIEASAEGRGTLVDMIQRVSRECFMPLTVGGGIADTDTIRELLRAGADKVVITTAAVENPGLIAEAAGLFGKQCIVVGIDVRREDGRHVVYTHSARTRTGVDLLQHVAEMERLGAGELFLNSIDHDGMMDGYDLELARTVRQRTSLPVIICGGAGHFAHLVAAIQDAGVQAVACASVFHFGDNNPIRARSFLKNAGIDVKNVK